MTGVRIGLFGATGAIGRSIGAALGAQGTPFRAVARSSDGLSRDFGAAPGAERIVWDPMDPASVRGAAAGLETIVYMVGVPYDRFELHPELFRRTIDGAIAAGVQQLLLIGTVYPYGRPRTEPVREDHPREPHTKKGRLRKAQEDVLLDADRAASIRGAILRLPDFYGPGVDKSFLHRAFVAARAGKRAPMIGPIDVRHEFVFVPDVGPVVVKLAQEPEAWGRAWHYGGPGTATQRDLATRIARAAGVKPRFMVLGKTGLRLAGIFDPTMRELVEMHYLLETPVVLDDRDLEGLLGPLDKTSYDAGIERTLRAS